MSLFKRIEQRFGTAGVVLGVIAMVLALGGSAFAAKNALTGKQKKEVKKFSKQFSKKFAKKFAKAGPAGPQGPAGPAGPKGDNGSNGSNGTDGKEGKQGPAGPGVLVNESFCGGSGGVEVEAEGSGEPHEVCNGEPGMLQPGEVLKPGVSLAGSWSALIPPTGPEGTEPGKIKDEYSNAVSFPIPLSTSLGFTKVKAVKPSESAPAECDNGEAPAPSVENPEADNGYLCMFVGKEEEAELLAVPALKMTTGVGASRTGFRLAVQGTPEKYVYGTYAVTGS